MPDGKSKHPDTRQPHASVGAARGAQRLTRPTRTLEGVGLFSAQPASVRFLPAPAGAGVCLRRLHAGGVAEGLAHVGLVTSDASWAGLPPGVPVRNTTLLLPASGGGGPMPLATVEHALGALAGLRVRDVIIEVRGAEVPILDGSALGFCDALREVLEDAPDDAPPIVLTREVLVRDARAGAWIRATPIVPGEAPTLTYHLDYAPRPVPPAASARLALAADAHSIGAFVLGVAPARTFSLRSEAQAARKAGLFAHLTPAEMLVLDDDTGTPLDNALRFADEPARHKLLDLAGDLLLLGRPLAAHVESHRAGHALTHELCREILRASPDAGPG